MRHEKHPPKQPVFRVNWTYIFKAQLLPIVIDGFNLPWSLNKGRFSVLVKGLFGLGSFGVPSTRVQSPILAFIPMTACLIRLEFPILEWFKTMDSLTLAPAPIDTFFPIRN